MTRLKYSKEARKNSTYFSLILMQKKLLYHALIDNVKLEKFNFPTTTHVLSKVFNLYLKFGSHEKKQYYVFQDNDDNKLSYKLYLIESQELSKMVIEEIYNSKIIKKHIYW
jgi:hypothetical protein